MSEQMNNTTNNRRIAKNTLLLTFRMLILLLISLYTSRVTLTQLGIEDYGIYNVVGGLVAMFTILSSSLSAAISRFITFELGRGDNGNVNKVFSASVTIQILISFLLVILIECIGVWFLNTKMNIPDIRMNAANWVLQFSTLTLVVNLVSVPYNACIIAHERMSAFAYVSIAEVLLKLLNAFLITVAPFDKLVFYALLGVLTSLIIRMIYGIYCNRNFSECHYKFQMDKGLLRQMFGFAGWNFIGASSTIIREHGCNILINLFFGPAINAARGIASQVYVTVNGFVMNYTTALNPQITKSYASGERDYMMTLIYRGARFSFYLLLFLALPVILNANYILELWLGQVPAHTPAFISLGLICALSESISYPLVTAMLATGNIRNYQLVVGGLNMMNLPVSYLFLRIGCVPEAVIIVSIAISQLCLFARLWMLRGTIGLSARRFLKKVYLNVVSVAMAAALIPGLLVFVMGNEALPKVAVTCIVSLLTSSLAILYFGCRRHEREFVFTRIRKVFHRSQQKNTTGQDIRHN